MLPAACAKHTETVSAPPAKSPVTLKSATQAPQTQRQVTPPAPRRSALVRTQTAATPSPAPTPVPTVTPSRTPAPAPTATAVPKPPPPSPEPISKAAVPPIAQAAPVRKPHDPPQIVAVTVDPTNVSPGETVRGTALTSSNVASVEARLQNLPNDAQFAANMNKVGVGKFTIAYPIPDLPAFAHGTYTVLVIARNVDGVQATRTVRLTLR